MFHLLTQAGQLMWQPLESPNSNSTPNLLLMHLYTHWFSKGPSEDPSAQSPLG